MARISFTAIVDEMIGKLAGSVFQYSYGGFQVHTKGKPRNPQTQYQQLRRGDFGFISASWRNLTSVQRQSFIDAAATEPEAFNLFIRSNINLILIGETMIDTYIPSSTPDPITVQIIDANPGVYIIQATGSPTIVPADTKALIYSTALKLPTKIFTNPSEYSPIIAFDEGTDLGVATDIIAAFNNRYGQLTADHRLCIKSVLIDKTNGSRGSESISCINSEDMPKFVKIFTDVSQPITSGTGSTQLVNFSIPANTLLNDGDIIQLCFAGKSSSLAGTGSINWSFNGTGNALESTLGSNTWQLTVRIQRISSTFASVAILYKKFGASSVQSTVTDNAVNWTASITTILSAQAPTSGAILVTQCDINKELV